MTDWQMIRKSQKIPQSEIAKTHVPVVVIDRGMLQSNVSSDQPSRVKPILISVTTDTLASWPVHVHVHHFIASQVSN